MSATNPPLPPPAPRMRLAASHKALLGMIVFLLAAKLIEMAAHIPFQNPSQQALFSWKSVIFFVAIALLGSGFAHVVGFPGMWDKGVSNRGRIWAPLAIGIVLGVGLLTVDHASGFAHLYAKTFGVSTLALPWGSQALFQLFAAVSASILYYLFAVAFAFWFLGTLLLSRHWPSQTFWVVAILAALWEPLAVAGAHHWALMRAEPVSVGMVGLLALIYTMNLAAIILFRRFGFTAALILRVSAITVWHILGPLSVVLGSR